VAVSEAAVGSAPEASFRISRRGRAAQDGVYARYLKRPLDAVAATLALVLLAPLLIVVAIVVRCTMGPGVIFRQERIGRGGKRFTVYKFRSMRPDRRQRETIDDFNGPDRRQTHKARNHPLVTPTGRILRKLSIDELPQLWNVARGDMSLVGPRPELPTVVAGYQPWQHDRHRVRPGLTGLWQVKARGLGEMHCHTEFDIEYVDSMSFTTDLKIMLMTPFAVFGSHSGF
jgi:lipopolysaccharide/colanic/teichoic acid biosynthesis glycosyltransferase